MAKILFMQPLTLITSIWRTSALGLLCLALGCDATPAGFARNELIIQRLSQETELDLEVVAKDIHVALEETFGTPDAPKWPEDDEAASLGLPEWIRWEQLDRAAGPVGRKQDKIERGLFRKHCAQCHGESGDGVGATAAFQSPYPRDFRRGTFKFKSTFNGYKPTRADLVRTIQHGIPGSAMPAFGLLLESKHTRDDIDITTAYVVYLAIRGEVERRLFSFAVRELKPGERLLDSELASTQPELFAVQRERFYGVLREVAKSWREAEDHVIPVDESLASQYQFPEDLQSNKKEALLASIERGEKIFRGETTACATCHGQQGAGDGKVHDFDEWTKDWTIRAGIDPQDKKQWKPMKKYGALKPQLDPPRNFALGVFRGGDAPADIYRRIVGGIEGSPMPAAPMQPDNPQGLTTEQAWDLVHFVMSRPYLLGGEDL